MAQTARISAALVILAISASGIAVFMAARDNSASLRIEKPAWLQPPPPESSFVQPALSTVAREKAPESPIKEMMSPQKLSSALQAAEQLVTFEASIQLEPTLSEHVAAEVVAAMDGHWVIYRSVKYQGRADSHAVQMDYLFAIWPDLGDLLEKKLATAQVFPVGPAAPRTSPPGFVNYGFDVTQEILTVSFQTPNWRTTITFTEASGNTDLFRRIVQVTNAELQAQK